MSTSPLCFETIVRLQVLCLACYGPLRRDVPVLVFLNRMGVRDTVVHQLYVDNVFWTKILQFRLLA